MSAIPQTPDALVHTQAPLARVRTSFDLTVPRPYADAVKLFGPEGERAWAGPHGNLNSFIHNPPPTLKAQSSPSDTAP